MKKVSLIDYGQLRLENAKPIESLLPGTVKVDVNACGICGSDIALFRGQRDLKNERYFGHEFSGVVTDAGLEANGIKKGMRVASELSRTCGQCWYCLNGLQNYCRSMNDALLPGGFTEETLVLNVPEYSFLTPIPDTLDDITATLLEPTNCSYHAVRQGKIKQGDTVAVFGLGTMGLIAARIAKSMGASTVIGIGRNAEKLKKIKELNFVDTVNCTDKDWVDQIHEMGGEKGVDVVIEATGSASVFQDAMTVVRPGGRIVVMSVYHNAPNVELWPIMRKEITIVGAKGPYPHRKTDGSSAAVEVLNDLQDDLKKLITVYDYKDALQAFDDMMAGRCFKTVISFK